VFLLITTLLPIKTCGATDAIAEKTNGSVDRGTVNAVALGERYENGESVGQDYRQARALYCQAAGKGDAQAAFNLGWMYLNGRGVPRDDLVAVAWLRKAAKGGVSQAVNLLAVLPQEQAASTASSCVVSRTVGAIRKDPPPEIRTLINQTAQDVGINPDLLSSVMAVESGFDSRAVSPKMAAGLMQLMPETAERYGVYDVFNERENIRGGATYLRDLLRMFEGNLVLALAAYNAGEAKVVLYGGIPPYSETENYVAAVKRLCACDQR
jgi:soluble lytic murein transglycosylase-like protein